MAEQKIGTSNQQVDYKDTVSEKYPPVMYVDLPLLARVIFRRKFVFGVFALISIILGILYLLIPPPLFRSEILFSQPKISPYPHLNDVGIAEIRLLPRELFFEYKGNLSSKANQKNFLVQNSIKYSNATFTQMDVESNDVDQDRIGRFRSITRTWSVTPKSQSGLLSRLFDDALRIDVSSELPEKYFFYLAVEFPKAGVSAQIANDYAAYVNLLTIKEIEARIQRRVSERRAAIEKEISHRINIARLERKHLIVQLQEQARIAHSLGYEDPVTASGDRIELMPLYFRGAKALQAQANILIGRSDDRPFVPNLAALESELVRLNHFPDKLPVTQAAFITRPAHPVSNPINSSFFFTLLVAIGLGVVIASIYNIFDYYLKN